MTEEKHIAEQHRQIVEQVIVIESKFLAAASHDLRQPLHTLVLSLVVLERRIPDSDILDILRKNRHSRESLNSLFNSLLDISKHGADIVEITFQTFSKRDMLISVASKNSLVASRLGLPLNRKICNSSIQTARRGLRQFEIILQLPVNSLTS